MKKNQNETVLTLLPDVPALQVAWVGEKTDLLSQVTAQVAPEEGQVQLFGLERIERLGQGAPRSFEVLILNPAQLEVDIALLRSCFERLENSALICFLDGLPDRALIEEAGLSNPSTIACQDGPLGVASKSFAWGNM